jgi:NADH-quinone oxidoreductase E subunit
MSFHAALPYGTPEFHRSMRVVLEEGPPFTYTTENRATLEEICTHYPSEQRRSAILAALYLVQEQQGYITANAARHVAEVIGCSAAEVDDVVSYYVMFYRQPTGKYVLAVCRTLSCALNGAERVIDTIQEKLGIKVGETDATGMFTLVEFECLGACDRAPVVMVNNEHWHEHQTPETVAALLDGLRSRGLGALTGCHLKVGENGG